ncbi:WavE lipopolysaccharide synthesis family protein [Polluticoccus soli]|uniref:WavE lipopolysaccharide synthesis family protein n=1 Tax=Polluticoccus soli TaxID=3034150 RepID=UPI0023E2816D|nr:WavE lipopolysaccharide synthesis family protein [Flavipsychrobacter sp. JY13-12]
MLSSDFSVVIQGPVIGKPGEPEVNQRTKQAIESVKKVLPEAEIIISTWEGTDVSHLDYDKVVFNADPGAITYNDHELKNVYNNNNRQIVSTYNGLKQATRKYAMKLRGDCTLLHSGFMVFLNGFLIKSRYSFFKHRILVPTIYSRNPRKVPLLYHVSDIFQVGFTEDMLDLWNIPLQPEPETTRAYSYDTRFYTDPFRFNGYKMRYAAEQYIWNAFTKKKGLNLDLAYYSQVPISKIYKAEFSIVSNFIIATPDQIGLQLSGTKVDDITRWELYTFEEWNQLYVKYCVEPTSLLKKLRLHVWYRMVVTYEVVKKSIKFT